MSPNSTPTIVCSTFLFVSPPRERRARTVAAKTRVTAFRLGDSMRRILILPNRPMIDGDVSVKFIAKFASVCNRRVHSQLPRVVVLLHAHARTSHMCASVHATVCVGVCVVRARAHVGTYVYNIYIHIYICTYICTRICGSAMCEYKCVHIRAPAACLRVSRTIVKYGEKIANVITNEYKKSGDCLKSFLVSRFCVRKMRVFFE